MQEVGTMYRHLRAWTKEKIYRLKRVVERLIRIWHMKTNSETFYRKWAELESKDTKFWTRYQSIWGETSHGELSSMIYIDGMERQTIGMAMMLDVEMERH